LAPFCGPKAAVCALHAVARNSPASSLEQVNARQLGPVLEARVFDVLWQVVPWAAAMAAACGAQLTISAAEQLKQLRAGKASVVPA
jgi:hypothetical protein